jgi:hypothetical protein
MHGPAEVLGAMITPAMLISAAALLLLSTAARLGRVNDRLQHLAVNVERFVSQNDNDANFRRQREISLQQLAGLEQRLVPLRAAVTGLYSAIALLVVTSILAGLDVVVPKVPSAVPIAGGMIAAVAFLYSIALLIQEARIATRATLREIAYVYELLGEEDTED